MKEEENAKFKKIQLFNQEEMSHEEARLEGLRTIFGDFGILNFKGVRRKSLNFGESEFLNVTWL